ncbi:MAG: WD40 repeat domain-containing protein, partial [Fimbriimonadaceae bacterium]
FQPLEDDDAKFAGLVLFSRFDVWTEALLASTVIKVPAVPDSDAAFAVSRDRKFAVLGHLVISIERAKIVCHLPSGPKFALVASEDLRVGMVMVGESFNRSVCLVDLRFGRILGGIQFMPKEVRSIGISFDGRIAAYGAYHGVKLIDVAKRQELNVLLPSRYKANGVRFSETGRQVAWMETGWNGSGFKIQVADISLRQVIGESADDWVSQPIAFTESGKLVLTHAGAVTDTSSGMVVQTTGHCPKEAARFDETGRHFHTGYELKEVGTQRPHGLNGRDRDPIVVLGKTNGYLIAQEDDSVLLKKYGDHRTQYSFRRRHDDRHFVSDWKGEHLVVGHLRGVSVTSDQTKALLGYDDGLLYVADLTSGVFRGVNTPASIRALINKGYRRFVEESHRSKTSDKVFRKRQGPRYCVAKTCINNAGDYAATVCEGENVRIWSVETGECVAALPIPFGKSLTEGEIDGLCFSNDGRFLIMLRADDRVMTWRFLYSKTARLLPQNRERFLSLTRKSIAEMNGTVAVCDGYSVVTWVLSDEDSPATERELPNAVWRVRINLRTRRILCWDTLEGASEITVRDFDSLAVIGRHMGTSENPEISNLADDGTFIVLSEHRGVEFMEVID